MAPKKPQRSFAGAMPCSTNRRGLPSACSSSNRRTLGRHIRERGFDKRYFLDLILQLVRIHGAVGRSELDDFLMPKLPDRMTDKQNRIKVQNLVQELRRGGSLHNRGTRASPRWALIGDEGTGI